MTRARGHVSSGGAADPVFEEGKSMLQLSVTTQETLAYLVQQWREACKSPSRDSSGPESRDRGQGF